jgi:hypothetical protein
VSAQPLAWKAASLIEEETFKFRWKNPNRKLQITNKSQWPKFKMTNSCCHQHVPDGRNMVQSKIPPGPPFFKGGKAGAPAAFVFARVVLKPHKAFTSSPIKKGDRGILKKHQSEWTSSIRYIRNPKQTNTWSLYFKILGHFLPKKTKRMLDKPFSLK